MEKREVTSFYLLLLKHNFSSKKNTLNPNISFSSQITHRHFYFVLCGYRQPIYRNSFMKWQSSPPKKKIKKSLEVNAYSYRGKHYNVIKSTV